MSEPSKEIQPSVSEVQPSAARTSAPRAIAAVTPAPATAAAASVQASTGTAIAEEVAPITETTAPASAPQANTAAVLRPIAAIIQDLSRPIKDRHLRQKVRSGTRLDFIPWYHAVKYLDLFAPGWCYEVRSAIWNTEGRLVLTVRLSIPCLEGIVYREATGTEEEPEDGEKMYGDPSSNAESMALRRAAAKFGLGLYLYDKGKK